MKLDSWWGGSPTMPMTCALVIPPPMELYAASRLSTPCLSRPSSLSLPPHADNTSAAAPASASCANARRPAGLCPCFINALLGFQTDSEWMDGAGMTSLTPLVKAYSIAPSRGPMVHRKRQRSARSGGTRARKHWHSGLCAGTRELQRLGGFGIGHEPDPCQPGLLRNANELSQLAIRHGSIGAQLQFGGRIAAGGFLPPP